MNIEGHYTDSNNYYSSDTKIACICSSRLCQHYITLIVPSLVTRSQLDVSRLLFDLKRCGELVNRFAGWLEPQAIAQCVTKGLVEQFNCAFARIWLVESGRKHLNLVASAGLYTRLDGDFAQVPMGAFKVGKIAQHCIPFLSNSLPDETWVKDRDWAIANRIQGFVGLPLIAEQQSIGVLAIFSHTTMSPEFLEVLQMLSLSVSGALSSALNHGAYVEKTSEKTQNTVKTKSPQTTALSEQLAIRLGHHKLSLLGVERPISSSIYRLFIRIAEYLHQRSCFYCRLVYDAEVVVLEAILSTTLDTTVLDKSAADEDQAFLAIQTKTQQLNGTVQRRVNDNQTMVEMRWQLPQVCEHVRSPSPLSEREQEVLELLAVGLRDRDISKKLFISERTVKFHTKNALSKLGVKTRTHAVFMATKQGWL